MDGTIDFNGRSVGVQIQYDAGLPASTAQFGFIVAQAVAAALHYPLTVTAQAIVIAIARTVTRISIEVDEARTYGRIQKQLNTASAYNKYLLILKDDNAWHPEVKAQLEYSLMEDLKGQLGRIRS